VNGASDIGATKAKDLGQMRGFATTRPGPQVSSFAASAMIRHVYLNKWNGRDGSFANCEWFWLLL